MLIEFFTVTLHVQSGVEEERDWFVFACLEAEMFGSCSNTSWKMNRSGLPHHVA